MANQKQARKPSVKKKKKNEAAQLKTLADIAHENVAKYNKVIHTNAAYNGSIRRGKEFLAKLIAQRKEDRIIVCEQGIPTDELEKALDNPPNQYSAMVVEMFIAQKCVVEGCQQQVAESIHAAFCRYWDAMDGTKYAGDYKLNKVTNEVSGCPARAPCVLAIKKAMQTCGKATNATRKHAEALSIEDERKLMQWSQCLCPHERLEEISSEKNGNGSTRPVKGKGEGALPLTVEEVHFIFEHGFMRAFVTSAFTLWTRCFELLSLTYGDLTQNCRGRAPWYTPHFKVHLYNRKGWQNAQGYEGPRTSNIYEIYPQDIPEIDMFTHLPRWLKLYAALLGRELEPGDQLFPHISANGTIYPKQEMSYATFSKLLTKFTSGANLVGWFTTHSFRQGGAQYRFVFAPRKWSLNKVRWWGGWAKGENVDTLMKYLLDSLQSYENGHGDALHPVPKGFGESFMGADVEASPVTAGEVRELKRSVDEKFDTIDENLGRKMDEMVGRITTSFTEAHLAGPRILQPRHRERGSLSVRTARLSAAPYNLMSRSSSISTSASNESEGGGLVSDSSGSLSHSKQNKKNERRAAPIQGVAIPNLKSGPDAWKQAVKQWEEGDEVAGLVALKDWPAEWYTRGMRTFTGSKRRDRELIVIAYNRVGRDEKAFEATYPEATKNMKSLLHAIRKKLADVVKPRTSRNGTPEERARSRGVSVDSSGITIDSIIATPLLNIIESITPIHLHMSNHGASQSQTTSTGLSGNDAGTNSNMETPAVRENNGLPNSPIGQNFDNSGIENHIITDVERLVELYRKSEQTKGSTLASLVRAVESSISPLDTRKNAIINYTALLDDIEHQRDVQSARGSAAGTGGNTGGGQDRQPQPTPSGNPRFPIPDKPIDDAINDLISSIHAGSDGSQSASESDRQDGEPSGKRKRRLNEKSLPWYDDEKRARVSSNPSLDKNRRIIALFARDLSKVKRLIGSAQTAPHGFPSSEWDNVIRGNPVNLDVVLSSLHHVSAPKENRGRIGDNEISLGRSDPTRKVETSGQWTSAWNATSKAIRFAFRHREDELREYADYIEGLFASSSSLTTPELSSTTKPCKRNPLLPLILPIVHSGSSFPWP
ncbi:hypothetical protein D9615_003084 [Tricholomella constricta]|uniref:Uncharacterized protein n=1 Tax=Tricholomella constricta TaxID=117010 RepID=A0A8H5HGD8_9AGAR|nr:hypothetical protein D9615_003084 [Tricholomella constricta]